MTVQEISNLIKAFGNAADLAIQAGFDGVEIHGANRYLIQQFYSEITNRRTDEWGGNIEKRMKFPLAVIDEVNKHVAIVYYTCLWLKENGFVNLDNSFSSQKMISNVILTAKGLEILKQTPQSIDGKSLGDNLKAAVQTGKDEFIKQAVNKIFSLSLNLIS